MPPASVAVSVAHLPPWLDRARLLGPGDWVENTDEDGTITARAALERRPAADLAARLRRVGLGGGLLKVGLHPSLPRALVRAARTADARRRRDTSPGFLRSGARLDQEGRWSLTPERLALALGRRHAGATVLDACCGLGGNAIGFARAGCTVVAIERNRGRLSAARHNARLYGVADQIDIIEGDARREVGRRRADVLFLDVPWGTEWNRERVALADLPLLEELLASARASRRYATIVAKVPPSFDPATTPGARPEGWFGHAAGDRQRVKFVLLTWEGAV